VHGGVFIYQIRQEKTERINKYIYIYIYIFIFLFLKRKMLFYFDEQESKATKNNHANLKNWQQNWLLKQSKQLAHLRESSN
jgi:hypothetical protein